MVSNDEIRKKLADRKEGKSQVKSSLNEDRTPSSEDIKEKFSKNRKFKVEMEDIYFVKTVKDIMNSNQTKL